MAAVSEIKRAASERQDDWLSGRTCVSLSLTQRSVDEDSSYESVVVCQQYYLPYHYLVLGVCKVDHTNMDPMIRKLPVILDSISETLDL